MATYSVSNIIGYASHIPTKTVKLPLKYFPLTRPVDVSEKFRSGCLNHSELVDLSTQKGCSFPSLQVGFTYDAHSVRLSPLLVDETTLLGFQYQNLNIELPHPIISNRTFVCQFVARNTSEEPYVLIDIIDQSYLLITLRIELSDFVVGNTTNRLGIDNFSEWVNICVPYSFELRSDPFCMKALDPFNIIVSLKDGGLLRFKRQDPLSAFDIFDFAESTSMMSLNVLNLIFKRSDSGDHVLNGVSSNASVDIIKISEDEFVTLSTTKLLTFWNLKTHKLSRPRIELGTSSEQPAWLFCVPNRYLRVNRCNGQARLSLFLPGTKNEKWRSSCFEIYNWDIQEEELSKAPTFSMDKIVNKHLEEDLDPSALVMQDFSVKSDGLFIVYDVLWKCNTHSSVVTFRVRELDGELESVKYSHTVTISPLKGLTSFHSDSEISDAIFRSGNFDETIVSTALEVLEQNLGRQHTTRDGSLRKHLHNVINSISSSQGISANSLWYKFALICEEFKKTSQEVLAFLPTPDYILTSQVSGVGVFRAAHPFEKYGWAAGPTELASLLNTIGSKFSLRVFKNVLAEIRNHKIVSASDATQFATAFLSSKICDEESQDLMASLASIPDVLDEINSLVDASGNVDAGTERSISLSAGEGCGLFSKILTVDVFKNIKKNHEQVLLNLFVLLLLCDINDTILAILNGIVLKFRAYDLMDHVFELCFKDSSSNSPIEVDTVSRSENCIFWTCAVRMHVPLLQLILRRDFGSAFEFYCSYILTDNRELFLLDIFLELLNRNEVKTILGEFKCIVDLSLPVVMFLFGLVYLFNNQYDDFYSAVENYNNFEKIDDKDLKLKILDRLSSQKVIKHFLCSVFSAHDLAKLAKANYYHLLSLLCVEYYDFWKSKKDIGSYDHKTGLLLKAVVFEKEAISVLDSGSDKSWHNVRITYLRNLFDGAVEIKNYADAISALSEIGDSVSTSELKALLTRLIRALLSNSQIHYVFEQKNSSLFRLNYLLVDSILLEIANEDLILSNAIQCYEYIYSWRLLGPVKIIEAGDAGYFGDVRGAAEALYIFVTRFKLESDILVSTSAEVEDYKQFKLRILELYKIIINCLKTFKSDDDRWIICRGSSKKLAVATVDELSIEYYKWLKELESELY